MPEIDMADDKQIIPIEIIERRIYVIRGQKIMLDRDLAELYGVETRRLNERVRRNINRFPEDFMFQLDETEFENWKSQIATSNPSMKMGLRKRPIAFTEHGILMLSSILNSERAIEVNIYIMRMFIHMREVLATHKDLADKIAEHDGQIAYLFEKIEQLTTYPEPEIHPIGFVPDEDKN